MCLCVLTAVNWVVRCVDGCLQGATPPPERCGSAASESNWRHLGYEVTFCGRRPDRMGLCACCGRCLRCPILSLGSHPGDQGGSLLDCMGQVACCATYRLHCLIPLLCRSLRWGLRICSCTVLACAHVGGSASVVPLVHSVTVFRWRSLMPSRSLRRPLGVVV